MTAARDSPPVVALGLIVAFMGVEVAIAVAGRSLVGLVLVALFAAFVERYTRLEERQLQRDFGSPYDEYRAAPPPPSRLGAGASPAPRRAPELRRPSCRPERNAHWRS